MGKGKKKPFIDKKKAVTFTLVHRSQQDPLIADDSAPDRILAAIKPESKKARLEEQQKCGVFFEDDYDYLQHLKQRGDSDEGVLERFVWEKKPSKEVVEDEQMERIDKLRIPSEMFASEREEAVGMLHLGVVNPGPHPEWDPDVVAALDDDFDFDDPENELEDDFMALANGGGEGDEEDEDEVDEEYDDEGDDSDDTSSCEASDDDDEKKCQESFGVADKFRCLDDREASTRFTEYSISSSVMKRNEQLSLLDDRFEEFFAGYDDMEMGPLDEEDLEGPIKPESAILMQLAEDFQKKKAAKEEKEKNAVRNAEEDSSEEEEMDRIVVESKPKWDCQSILSTHSNLYNRPKLIVEPPKSRIRLGKHGVPMANDGKLTKKTLSDFDRVNGAGGFPIARKADEETLVSQISKFSIRPSTETAEQRKERKRMVKSLRRERRLEKKMNSILFKEEKLMASKRELRNDQPGMKIAL